MKEVIREEERLLTRADLRKRIRPAEYIAEKVVTGIALLSLAAIVLIFVFVFREAAPVFFQKSVDPTAAAAPPQAAQETYGEEMVAKRADDAHAATHSSENSSGESAVVTAGNLLGDVWQPVSSVPKYGLLPLAVGSFKVTLLAILFAAPIAILAALFTSSFAPRWSREILKPAIEILAGFPSVVIGFFGLVTLATLLQNVFGYTYRLNAFVGGVAMSLAVIPIIYTVSEDALNAIPRYLTEASLALGASKWETALFVTLPAATPGVFAAVVLGFGRAFGETMIVLMVTGNAALVSAGMFEPVRTMSATIGSEMAEVVFGETHYTILFLIGAILFVFTFSLNAFAEVFVRQRLLRRFKGA
jgi:phosphate transport system permease protein